MARKKIGKYLPATPVRVSKYLGEIGRCKVYLKLENRQPTGSFKVRGAFNKILSLTKAQRKAGIVTASSGNHGLAVAYALGEVGGSGQVFLPVNAAPTKIEKLKKFKIPVAFHGDDGEQTETHARKIARQKGLVYVSPYNDEKVVEGQGTIAVEMLEQLKNLDTVYVAVGGGGLIGGIAMYLKSQRKPVRIVGCLPKNSDVMYQCVQKGRIVATKMKPTLSDGTAGGLEKGSITFDLCRKYVDEYRIVSEKSIREAIRVMYHQQRMKIEGAAGVAVAGFLQDSKKVSGQTVAIVVCGENIAPAELRKIV
ncbi:MAG TPA: threonine/serine dehydratase [Candidatus Angelobacter sp.]|nr:threonine/serine dehydratase [Candidatus Angelobacter sp.]